MPNELHYQRLIVSKIKKEGGYAKKWASQWSVGVPDLVAVHPEVGAVFIEIKLMKNLSQKFRRKINITVKQRYEL